MKRWLPALAIGLLGCGTDPTPAAPDAQADTGIDAFDAMMAPDVPPTMDAPTGDAPRMDAPTMDLQALDGFMGDTGPDVPPAPEMTPEEFEQAKVIFFDRCAGCHGALRAGGTGPALAPTTMRIRGTERLRTILTNGLPGGMPAWGRAGILTMSQIDLMARYVQLPAPVPPPRPIEQIRASWELTIPVAARPTSPTTTRNWENFFGVILRDAGRVAIIDGDRHDLVAIINTGFAVHILRSSSTGRYFYAIGRDGVVTMIDLWAPTPNVVAHVQGCSDARSVESSKAAGWEDRLLIEGCYWPSQYVVFDGQTLEPRSVTNVMSTTFDTHEVIPEVRVAAITASHTEPIWLVSLKESGYVDVVDYSRPGYPVVSMIGAERYLHDGGFDHTGRYFMVAANQRNRMAIIDMQERRLVSTFITGLLPHPGRGATWDDPMYGWVGATTHIGQGRMAIYGTDPVAHPENAWRVVRNVELPNGGSLFLKTHPNSPWVWTDSPLSSTGEGPHQICVYSKREMRLNRCWNAATHGQAVHFEYNRAGTEVWVSIWDRAGEIVIYDDATLRETARITGDWLVTPTGKFNVYNTAHDVY